MSSWSQERQEAVKRGWLQDRNEKAEKVRLAAERFEHFGNLKKVLIKSLNRLKEESRDQGCNEALETLSALINSADMNANVLSDLDNFTTNIFYPVSDDPKEPMSPTLELWWRLWWTYQTSTTTSVWSTVQPGDKSIMHYDTTQRKYIDGEWYGQYH